MARDWTDAEFEVIFSPKRVGDPHPTLAGWRYAGVDDSGRELWRRPPRVTRLQLVGLLMAATLGLQALVYTVAELLAHH